MKFAYQPVTPSELKNVHGPRPGTVALQDVIVTKMFARGVRSAGIYNRRPIRGKVVLTARTASLHAAGRGLDISVPNKQIGDELYLKIAAAADAIGVCEIIWWDRRLTSKGEKPYKGVDRHHAHLHIGMVADIADRKNDENLRRWFSHFLFG